MSSELRIGLALGGGGARGMAHVLVCEAFDELGVKPALIAGTSIGAIIGAGYAAGLSGRQMRESACAFYAKRREVLTKLWRARPVAFTDLLRGRSLSAQFNPELILGSFVPDFDRVPKTFEELQIPLRVIACDFYGWTECVLSTGPLRSAIAASIAIPALFRPVSLDGRVLIDGGACNPLPFEHIGDCAVTVACDVAGGPSSDAARIPRTMECIVGAAQISMQTIIREKLRHRQPDILVRPEINGVFVLDFLKTETILAMNVVFKDDLKRRLDAAINTPFQPPEASAPVREEATKQSGRRRFADSGINLWRMMAGARPKEADSMVNPTPLGIPRAVIEPTDAGEGDGRGA
jgi:NTE family protein